MSAVVIQLDTHRPHLYRVGATTIPAIRTQIAEKVREHCELFSFTEEQIGLCISTALQRFMNCGHKLNAIEAGKSHADRIFRASLKPKGDGQRAP